MCFLKKLLLSKIYKYTEEQLKAIQELGYEITLIEKEKDDLPEEAFACEVMVQYNMFRYHDIKKFKNLKYALGMLAGLDGVPLDYMHENKITASSGRGLYSIPIAEFTLMRILEIYKEAKLFQKQQIEKTWQIKKELGDLYGKTAAILGTGSIGTEIAKRLKAFDVKTIGFNRSCKRPEYFDKVYSIKDLKKEVKHCDIVVVALPLDRTSKKLIDKEIFEAMKDQTVFINIGRGATVDETALNEVLESGKLLGAGIDVFETEPLPQDSPLWEKENLYFSPHISFASESNRQRQFDLIYNNLKAYIKNERINNIV